jgi:para-aminobenzoate synthetase/4-amino-4-deoxychorismate lyase
MPEPPRVRFDDMSPNGGSFFLSGFVGELSATSPHQVVKALAEIEEASREGLWAAGYVAYEAAPAFDPKMVVKIGQSQLPLVWFGLFESRIRASRIPTVPRLAAGTFDCEWTEIEYARAVAKAKELIRQGSSYQINLTTRFRGRVEDPWSLYCSLAAAQRGCFSAFIVNEHHAIASASPELFFDVAEGEIATRPMKGTSRRGATPDDDSLRAKALQQSPKERAENVMIVDMCRNDLGRVSVPGSVRVRNLFETEPYPNVWQLTSTIDARLRRELSLADIIGALFPPASVTGAPRHATMEAIADLEQSPRGVYCGTVGIVEPSTSDIRARFAVAIRTAVIDLAGHECVYGSGGGVTWSSTPEGEWQELLDKAAILGGQ